MKKNIFTLTPDDIELATHPGRGIVADDERELMPKKTPLITKKHVSWRVINWAIDQYKRWVQETYDDPSDVGPSAIEHRRWIDHAVALGEELGLDFDEVVTDVASPYEIRRFDMRCTERYWNSK